MTHFNGDLKVVIDHGGQRVEFESPGEENTAGLDEFGFSLGSITAPFRHAAKAAARTVVHAEHFAENAALAAGHGAHTLAKVTHPVTGLVDSAARRVPFVGKPLASAIGLSSAPIDLAERVAAGDRLDRVAIESLRKAARNAREVAPYAQLVAASVPGIGTGVAAGIAAGSALADGRPINDAVVAAARAAVPGGPAAQACFDAAIAAGKGGNPADIARAGVLGTLSPAQRAQVSAALEVASAASRGKPLEPAALSAASTALDPEARDLAAGWIGKPGANSKLYDALVRNLSPAARRAIVSGVALGYAHERQRDLGAAVSSLRSRDALIAVGRAATSKSDVLRSARSRVPDERSFDLGVGLMQHRDVPRNAILMLRDQLRKDRERLSFDAALATHVGAVTSHPFPRGTSARARIGYYAVAGSLVGSDEQRRGIVRILARKDPESSRGAAAAVRDVRKRRAWWRRVLTWLQQKTHVGFRK